MVGRRRGTTYALDGLAALDGTGVAGALAAAAGDDLSVGGDRKNGESKSGESCEAREHVGWVARVVEVDCA